MKKIIGLLALILMLNGCNDGELTIDTIDFDDIKASSCGELIYKLKDNEALFMNIPATKNAFTNDETPENEPREIAIEGDVVVKYRFYNGTVSSDNICIVAGPITPTATNEWTATSGTIQITTKATYTTPNPETGQKKITGYTHSIVFKNIVFTKIDGTNQKYNTFSFGSYQTTITPLSFSFDPELVRQCDSKTKIFNARNNGAESLVIENVDPLLIQNTATVTQPISATTNKLVYRVYKSSLPTTLALPDYFCATTTPSSPVISEEWVATEGTIEVNTTTAGGILHAITLKNVTFKKGNSSFYYGDSILYGNLLLAN